ncbi:MAG: Txe/YoeB family addiction module toxin [Treponema sp.]|jgi:toxin YoeB|nr:Txe/YoeB family addiction module toxin [Treponema sp.]
MSSINFIDEGWEDYQYWQTQDRKTLKRINVLIDDIERNGNVGIGKPEALCNELSGFYSRRIDEKNRLIYRILDDGTIELHTCRSHYGDK